MTWKAALFSAAAGLEWDTTCQDVFLSSRDVLYLAGSSMREQLVILFGLFGNIWVRYELIRIDVPIILIFFCM